MSRVSLAHRCGNLYNEIIKKEVPKMKMKSEKEKRLEVLESVYTGLADDFYGKFTKELSPDNPDATIILEVDNLDLSGPPLDAFRTSLPLFDSVEMRNTGRDTIEIVGTLTDIWEKIK